MLLLAAGAVRCGRGWLVLRGEVLAAGAWLLSCGREGGGRLIPRGGDPPVRRRHVAGRRDVAEGRAWMLDNARCAREDNERADRMTQPEFWATGLDRRDRDPSDRALSGCTELPHQCGNARLVG